MLFGARGYPMNHSAAQSVTCGYLRVIALVLSVKRGGERQGTGRAWRHGSPVLSRQPVALVRRTPP
jgi:hypothetical protein